jgi:hypothetical protein
VEEEGEVFRKGNILLGPEEMEGEYAGEELRKEVRIWIFLFRMRKWLDSYFYYADSFWKRWWNVLPLVPWSTNLG